MAATFTVETGSALAAANSLVSVADADQIDENFTSSSAWVAATDEEKQNALREATRYLNYYYQWAGWKVDEDQGCKWPRYQIYDEDGNAVDSDIVPQRVKEATTYLAVKIVADGDTLLPDFTNISQIKKSKEVVGPLTDEKEYVTGESPNKTYTVADQLVAPYLSYEVGGSFGTEIVRS